MLVSSYKLINI